MRQGIDRSKIFALPFVECKVFKDLTDDQWYVDDYCSVAVVFADSPSDAVKKWAFNKGIEFPPFIINTYDMLRVIEVSTECVLGYPVTLEHLETLAEICVLKVAEANGEAIDKDRLTTLAGEIMYQESLRFAEESISWVAAVGEGQSAPVFEEYMDRLTEESKEKIKKITRDMETESNNYSGLFRDKRSGIKRKEFDRAQEILDKMLNPEKEDTETNVAPKTMSTMPISSKKTESVDITSIIKEMLEGVAPELAQTLSDSLMPKNSSKKTKDFLDLLIENDKD